MATRKKKSKRVRNRTKKPRKKLLRKARPRTKKTTKRKKPKLAVRRKRVAKTKVRRRAKKLRKPSKKPAKRVRRRLRRVPASKKSKKVTKKSKQPKKVAKKKKRVRKDVVHVQERQLIAERVLTGWLDDLWNLMEGAGNAYRFDTQIKAFLNDDGSVDAELRVSDIPHEWKTEEGIIQMEAFFSRLLRRNGPVVPENEGGEYWISIGIRFGAQSEAEAGDMAELYKRFRGLFQVAAYPTFATMAAGLQNNIASAGVIIKAMMSKHGSKPSVVLIRLTWTPDGVRPGRYKGEKGGGQ